MISQLNKKKTYLLLLFIVLFGSFLKFYAIGDESFWLDESATAHAIRDYSLKETVQNVYFAGSVNPGYWEEIKGYYSQSDLPLYYVILELWSQLFGIDETSLRLFSALMGIIFTILLFFLAKDLFNTKIALISSLLSSINLTIIYYSQEARVYIFLLVLATASSYLFFKALSTARTIYWVTFVIVSIAGFYSHYFYIFFFSSQTLFLLLYLKKYSKQIKKILFSFFIIGVFFLPLFPRLFQRGAESVLGRPTFESIIRMIVQFNSWLYPSLELQQNIYSKSFYLFSFSEWLLIFSVVFLSIILPVFFIFCVIKYTNFRRNIRDFFSANYKLIFLLLWLIIPFLLEFFISIIHPTVRVFGLIRYLLFSFPPYLILVSFGLTRLNKKYLSIVLASILIASILPLNAYYSNPNKEQWKEVSEYVKNNIEPNEALLFNRHTTRIPFLYYYGDADNIFGVRNVAEAQTLSENKKGVWLILSFDKYSDPEGKIKSSLDNSFPNSQERVFFDVRVIHYNTN